MCHEDKKIKDYSVHFTVDIGMLRHHLYIIDETINRNHGLLQIPSLCTKLANLKSLYKVISLNVYTCFDNMLECLVLLRIAETFSNSQLMQWLALLLHSKNTPGLNLPAGFCGFCPGTLACSVFLIQWLVTRLSHIGASQSSSSSRHTSASVVVRRLWIRSLHSKFTSICEIHN